MSPKIQLVSVEGARARVQEVPEQYWKYWELKNSKELSPNLNFIGGASVQ